MSLSLGAVRLAALADRLMKIGQRELEDTAGERHSDLRKSTDLSLAALDALGESLSSRLTTTGSGGRGPDGATGVSGMPP